MSETQETQDLWWEFTDSHDFCGLCGNSGVIDTRGRVFTAAGVSCGVLAFCLCPNGRAFKVGGANLALMGDPLALAQWRYEQGLAPPTLPSSSGGLNPLRHVYVANADLQRAYERLRTPCACLPISPDGRVRTKPCACQLEQLRVAVAALNEALKVLAQ